MAIEKKKLMTYLISGGIALFVLLFWGIDAFQDLENKSADMRFKIRGQSEVSKDIAIIAFDEESFKYLGRWPWPRKKHGQVVDRLRRAGAKAIVFDMLLPEPDLEHPASDAYFAGALKRSGRVVLASYFQYDDRGDPVDFLMPISRFLKQSYIGFANIVPELDGVCRKIPLFKQYEGNIVPSLSLASLAVFLDKDPVEIIKSRNIHIDEYHEMLINFAGGYESFPYYSYYDVLSGKVPPEKFKDKLVLLGGTASGLFDFKPIPFSPTFPGVEIHANTISNILLGNYLKPCSSLIVFLFIIIFALVPGFVLNRLSPLYAGGVILAAMLGYTLFVFYVFASNYVYIEFVAPVLSFALSYFGVLFYRFMTEEKEKRWIKKTFGQYVSPKVLEKIMADPASLKLGGQKQVLTVLFSDIRGFTTITESLPPEELVSQLNEYLSSMVEVVFRYDGYLDKFIGDAVMAIWGAPAPQNDHARRAVLCAIEMMEELGKLNEKWRAEGKKEFDIGIGVNTGEMTVGNTGSAGKLQYTVLGDNVNLASRLEGLNKEYKTHIIVSEATYRIVKDSVEAKHLAAVKVKGKTKAVEIYQVKGRKE
ncbi:MAG: adenylate/guanylate cyclase domain-containing protein [Endomicrobiales bacterium]|nr:adenylate/guanylate cyclase domain-containing protein [Endomicrobiales bacterium]